jgi:Protein of unknown function (DUF2726)
MEILLALALFIVALYIFRRAIIPLLKPPDAFQPSDGKAEQHERQLAAVTRPGVTFRKKQIMSRGEFDLFCAAMTVTDQRLPRAFYVFPQVSLGEVLGSEDQDAHDAIKCKRGDLLLADRRGNPIAVLEYQGSEHDIDGTAIGRDRIKLEALKRAEVRYVPIPDGTPQDEMQRIIRGLLPPVSTGPISVDDQNGLE